MECERESSSGWISQQTVVSFDSVAGILSNSENHLPYKLFVVSMILLDANKEARTNKKTHDPTQRGRHCEGKDLADYCYENEDGHGIFRLVPGVFHRDRFLLRLAAIETHFVANFFHVPVSLSARRDKKTWKKLHAFVEPFFQSCRYT